MCAFRLIRLRQPVATGTPIGIVRQVALTENTIVRCIALADAVLIFPRIFHELLAGAATANRDTTVSLCRSGSHAGVVVVTNTRQRWVIATFATQTLKLRFAACALVFTDAVAADEVRAARRIVLSLDTTPAAGIACVAGIAGYPHALVTTLASRRILGLAIGASDRGTLALAGAVVEFLAIGAGRIDTVVLATDARRSAGSPVIQAIAEAALTRLGIHLVVFAFRIAGVLTTDAVTIARQRLARPRFALLTIATRVAARPAVVVVALGIDAGVPTQRLVGKALARAIVTGDIRSTRVAAGAAVVGVGVEVDARVVAQLLIVWTGALPGNTFLPILTGVSATPAVVRIVFKIGTAPRATTGLVPETTGGIVLAGMRFQRKCDGTTLGAGERFEMTRPMMSEGVVAVGFALAHQIQCLLPARCSATHEGRGRLG